MPVKIDNALTTEIIEAQLLESRLNNKQKMLTDGRGLVLHVRGTGKAKWYLRYRHPVSRTECLFDLGPYPEVSLEQVRPLAQVQRDLLSEGKDPNEEARIALAAKYAPPPPPPPKPISLTVLSLYERWASEVLTHHKDLGKSAFQILSKDVFPTLGGKAAEEVSPADILDVLKGPMSRGSGHVGMRVFSLIRQLFRYGYDKELIPKDPTYRIRKESLRKDVLASGIHPRSKSPTPQEISHENRN